MLFVAPGAAARIERAVAFLAARGRSERVTILAGSAEAAAGVVREAVARAADRAAALQTAAFGWRRSTLGRLAGALAAEELAAQGLAPAGGVVIEALCARVVQALAGEGRLGRFQAIAGRPGLPRALARTIAELRMGGIGPEALPPASADLARVQAGYEAALLSELLADRALVFRLAAERARGGAAHALLGAPLLLVDLPVASARERDLVQALAGRAPEVLAVEPAGDERTLANLEGALGIAPAPSPAPETAPETRVAGADAGAGAVGALRRLQARLFDETPIEGGELGEEVTILSAPGESRECVEIARRICREAERGVPFDQMAILLRSPEQYRPLVEEALARAELPAHFARGTVRPDPAGRALLALLACAAEGLSAKRFAEYLSLGELPDAGAGGQPPPASDRWVPPDEEMGGTGDTKQVHVPAEAKQVHVPAPGGTGDTKQVHVPAPVQAGTLRAPRRWERLLVDAAVIGGSDRWVRRLDGLRAELELDLAVAERAGDASAERVRRDLAYLANLRAYALPLVEALAALPRAARWGEWRERLSALATRALRRPERVLGVLAELAPMATVGPVTLAEVRLVLGPRLTDLTLPPAERRYGKVFVGPIEAARGLAFAVVFVPGLAEKLFPHRVAEDPLLPDREREPLRLATNRDRVAEERLALRIAVGAARERLVLSYPRMDLALARPRMPSFYGLEVLRAGEGRLGGFEELARRAGQESAARLGWPAPADPAHAVDETEYDLAVLERLLHQRSGAKGAARYLLGQNPHLARALRARALRWRPAWSSADGLVKIGAQAQAELARHALGARAWSPTGLQNFAACPYRFFLEGILRLAPREEPEAIEEMDPLQRGSLVHEAQFQLLGLLRDAGLLPVTAANLGRAQALLDRALEEVAVRYHDQLAPAVERVWEDGVASIHADLREWLRRAAEEPEWVPWRFELSFGLAGRRARDPASVEEPVALDCGVRLRGAIDLVERTTAGALRVTDHKTGRVRAQDGDVIGGGKVLQPALYALAVEKLEPQAKVECGRLYYCTSAGGFREVLFPLDAAARDAVRQVAQTIGRALERGFLPAAPDQGACEWCDYRMVCGPEEELRAGRKYASGIGPLLKLRGMP